MKTQVSLAFYLFLCFGTAVECLGQTVIAWKTDGEIAGTQYSTTTHALLQTAELSRGSGVAYIEVSPDSYLGLFPYSGNDDIPSTKAMALAENSYYQVKLQAKPGTVLSLSGIRSRLTRGDANSPNSFRWSYSTDNGANFFEIGAGDVSMTSTSTNGNTQDVIDLASIGNLQNLTASTSIIFRMYAWGRLGSEASTSSYFGFGISTTSGTLQNALEFTGVVEMPVPYTPILTWRPPTNINGALPATEADENIATAELSRGSGLTFSNGSSYTYTSTFPVNASKAEAEVANVYYEVIMQAKSGYYINLDGLTSRIRRQVQTTPNTYRWSYSVNGASFTDVGPGDVTMSLIAHNDTNGEDQYLIDLSGITALQNVPSSKSIKFRLYVWGGTATTGNMGFGKSYIAETTTDRNSLTFYGSVVNTLPVKLTSFKGLTEGNAIKLTWITASEQNNSHFEILRSSTSESGTVIGMVNSNKTDINAQNYNFKDYTPLQGTNYYQLRQVDYDGKSELSEIIAIKTDLNYPELSVTASETGIRVYTQGDTKGNAQLLVYDVTGRLLLDRTLIITSDNNVLDIPITGYTKGIYIASLIMPDGKRLNTRFYR